MSINLEDERIIRLVEVADLPFMRGRIPGKKLSRATLWRWALSGRLETITIGGSRFTSIEAVQRMIAGGSQPGAAAAVPVPVTTASRRKAVERAKLELDAIGI